MFSKSKSKRFQEPVSDGPAVGQYDVKDLSAKTKAVSFIKDRRWKDGEENNRGCGSLENLSSGGFSFGHKPLVPVAQSTCMSKKNRRKSCFPVSNSATDLRSCRRLNLTRSLEDDIGGRSDEVSILKEKINKLKQEIDELKSSCEKMKVSNDELKASLDEILNEKLATELEKQKLERSMKSLKREELVKAEKLSNCINEIESTLPTILNEATKSFNDLEGKQEDYLRRLDAANTSLGSIKLASDNNSVKFQQLDERCNNLQNQYDALIAEKNFKEHLCAEQEKELAELTININSLKDQLKAKDDFCDSLNIKLDHTAKEKAKTETAFSEEKEKISKQLTGLELLHAKELKEASEKLLASENLNSECRKQIGNVELSMTENIRELSRKYECLEETFNNTQKGYERSLERSNSLVQKLTLANKLNNEEFENLRNMYTELQHNYEDLCVDSETKDKLLMQKDWEIKDHVCKFTSLKKELDSAERNKEVCNMLSKQVDDLNKSLVDRDEKIVQHETNIKLLEDKLGSVKRAKEDSYNSLSKEIYHLRQEVLVKDGSISEAENSMNLLKDQLNSMEKAHKDACDVLNKQICSITQELDDKQLMYKAEKECLLGELSEAKLSMEASASSLSQDDIDQLLMKLSEAENIGESWKLKYEDLERKVGPFMDQLEQYEFEKQALLNQNLFSQQEMKQLSEKYGQILGHQNNKQKIRHVSKLKEENLKLKADLVKLRSNADKDRSKINQLEGKISGKRFDPSKSFLHGADKENRDALRTVNS